MTRENRTPEENTCREKICELLQLKNIERFNNIQNLFKETISKFMGNGLVVELNDEVGQPQ